MTSSFSDKPYSSRPESLRSDDREEPSLTVRREPGLRFNWRRFLIGMAFLLILTGLLLICFIPGGLLNPFRHWDGSVQRPLDLPGHIVGFVLLGVGAVLVVVIFSLERRP